MTEEEIGVKKSQAKECLELPEARGSKERMVPGDFRDSTALLAPGISRLPELWENIILFF